MKSLIPVFGLLFSLFLAFASVENAHAKSGSRQNASKGQKSSKAAPKLQTKASTRMKKLSTDINFEDLLVKGQYQYPDEAMVTVDDEKGLDDLLQVRPHFKDRLNQASMRR